MGNSGDAWTPCLSGTCWVKLLFLNFTLSLYGCNSGQFGVEMGFPFPQSRLKMPNLTCRCQDQMVSPFHSEEIY